MEEIKQVLVVRKDLKMRTGKCASQAAHAAMKVFLDRSIMTIDEDSGEKILTIKLTEDMASWISKSFTKICVYVESEAELINLYQQALESGLPASLILDEGRTEFGGKATLTCCAIGPAESKEVNKITGHLKLY